MSLPLSSGCCIQLEQDGEGEDKLWWVFSKRGVFVVRSFYSVLACNDGLGFPWSSVWQLRLL
jgi:hypothetical protein